MNLDSFKLWLTGRRAYVLLLAVTLVVRIATALPLTQPGYMDASYAILVARNLAAGRGLTEDVLWNYLDGPAGLPHPSNLYWMPLPSLLIAPFFAFWGDSYRVAQIPFVLLSLLVPLLTFHIGRKVHGRDDYACVAALLTVFSGFYMVYWVSPDNFTPFAVTAALGLYAMARGVETRRARYWLAAGALVGLSHLSRADGVLLLAAVPLTVLLHPWLGRRGNSALPAWRQTSTPLAAFQPGVPAAARPVTSDVLTAGHLASAGGQSDSASHFVGIADTAPGQRHRGGVELDGVLARSLGFTLIAVFGYLIVMAPWFVRDYMAVGTPYPSAGTKTLWLTGYDELFRYADDLTPARYWAWGLVSILTSKVVAVGRGLLVLSFSDALLFLTPFVLIGLGKLWRRVELLPFMIYGTLLFWVMALAFTFPSWRGTLLHSGIALLPFCSIAVPAGIDALVRWVASRRRTWNIAGALAFFQAGFVALAVLFSFYIYGLGLFGSSAGREVPLWNDRDVEYPEIGAWLDLHGRPEDAVLVVDPPSFHNNTGRRAIVTPTDGVGALRAAASRYGARYLVLEYDHPRSLDELYAQRTTIPGLAVVAEFRDAAGHRVGLFEVAP